MCKFTCYYTITMLVIFLQHQIVSSSATAIHLSPTKQKIALFQFKLSLAISTPQICSYYYDIPSHPKTMNWSMSSDHCTWEGVSCEHKTGNVIGVDLSCSQLEGAILANSTLFQLSHLQFLNLSWNDFSLSNEFPQEFGFFAKGLTQLNLSYTQFSGRVPSGISHLYKLVSLDLTDNYEAKVEEEVFKSVMQNMSQLRVLNLKYVNISSVVPTNLSTSLRVLNLYDTWGLHGVLPQEVFHLPNLQVLDLSWNENLRGRLPKVKWGSSATLQVLYLSGIDMDGGRLPDSIGFLESLTFLGLSGCNFSGPIPPSIGNLGQLTYLGLRGNNFNGPIPTFLANLTNLTHLYLSHNNFTGLLPGKIMFSQLVNLIDLYFSSNNFGGVLDIGWFSRLESLETLDFSHNSFSTTIATTATLPPKLEYLDLSSCNMKEFPRFSRDANIKLYHLDLSNNQIEGEIAPWIGLIAWNKWGNSYLNLSHNRLTGDLEQLPWNNINYLDLQSNMLNGPLPTLICNSSFLEVLNLSNNKLGGVLPVCPENLTRLAVFDLRMNNIEGNLPSTLSNFRNLQSLNLYGNKLEGTIPSSFAEFTYLEMLDLGRNQINDTFPHCLEALPNLQVLVLKSNQFHGLLNKSSMVEHPFRSLRIIDLSFNEFSGPLPAIFFRNFKAMMNSEVNKIKRSYMDHSIYYSDSTTLVIKGQEVELVRILTIFTTIDVSSNHFDGEIVESIGNLASLRYLNLSHNYLRGHIPSEIGKLSMLESLDLSYNQLEGQIPQQLTNIYTLARLNMSCNQLSGHIPQGSQFNTFENDSYVGNLGLCGKPLSKECEHNTVMQKEGEDEDEYFFDGFTWEAVVIGYGCGVVPAFIIGYIMLLAGKPKWFAGIIGSELGLKIRRMEIRM